MLLGSGILKAILETVYYEGMVASSLLLQYQHVCVLFSRHWRMPSWPSTAG